METENSDVLSPGTKAIVTSGSGSFPPPQRPLSPTPKKIEWPDNEKAGFDAQYKNQVKS